MLISGLNLAARATTRCPQHGPPSRKLTALHQNATGLELYLQLPKPSFLEVTFNFDIGLIIKSYNNDDFGSRWYLLQAPMLSSKPSQGFEELWGLWGLGFRTSGEGLGVGVEGPEVVGCLLQAFVKVVPGNTFSLRIHAETVRQEVVPFLAIA